MLCLSGQRLVFYNCMYFSWGVSKGIFCVLKCQRNKNTCSVLEVSGSFSVNMSAFVGLFLQTISMLLSSIGCYYKQ